MSPNNRLARLRRHAHARGMLIRKSRRKADVGGLMLVDSGTGFVVAGTDHSGRGYALDLDGIETWLSDAVGEDGAGSAGASE